MLLSRPLIALSRRLITNQRRGLANYIGLQNDHEDFGDYSIILPEEPFVFGVSHITPRPVPKWITRPPYAMDSSPTRQPSLEHVRIPLGGEPEYRVRQAAKLAKRVRDFAGTLVKVGKTTNEIDAEVHDFIIAHSAYPSPLLYHGFPKACCTSINNVIAHGIPDDRPLEEGDIINIDITVYLNGYHGDTSKTFHVGHVDSQAHALTSITSAALQAAISACGPTKPFKTIGAAIQEVLHDKPYCVSTQFSGHGIGRLFHRPPWILHHRNDEPGVMLPGDCFTIEPCIIQGSNPRGWIFPDGWSASTENCARSAQEEHMVLITADGVDVLTQ